MNDTAKIDRAIRIDLIAGGLMLAIVAVSIAFVATGVAPMGPRMVVWLVFGVVPALLTLWTARSMRQDRDDPAGIERRFEETATRLGAAVIVLGLASVAGRSSGAS
jgi:cadmium resistance protein CadD (predicted permease)